MICKHNKLGFSLIEISIVLVIIGLLLGGIIGGRALIEGAAIKSQLSQLDTFRTAAYSFRDKYFFWPGDLPNAAQFGLHDRQNCPGFGDGNGQIEGASAAGSPCGGATCGDGTYAANGETSLFWQDLGRMGFISGPGIIMPDGDYSGQTVGMTVNDAFPKAKIGTNNYVMVWGGGYGSYPCVQGDGARHFFSIHSYTPDNTILIAHSSLRATTIPVGVAYNIDMKTDDGLPQSGRVMAIYPTNNSGMSQGAVWWAAGNRLRGASTQSAAPGSAGSPNSTFSRPTTTATAYAATNCYDNDNTGGAAQQYSLRNENTGNCSISVEF